MIFYPREFDREYYFVVKNVDGKLINSFPREFHGSRVYTLKSNGRDFEVTIVTTVRFFYFQSWWLSVERIKLAQKKKKKSSSRNFDENHRW